MSLQAMDEVREETSSASSEDSGLGSAKSYEAEHALPVGKSPLAFLAKAISFLFHPIFTSSLGFALLIYNSQGLSLVEDSSSTSLLQLMAITATAMPLALIALMVSLGFIRDIQMPTRQSRLMPMLTMFGYYLGLGLILRYKLPGAELVSDYLLLLAGITALTTAITVFFKISGHSISIACFAGLYTIAGALSGYFGMGIVLACTVLTGGVVGWARLYLNAHKPQEIYIGWVLGYAFGLFAGWVLLS